MTEPTESDFLPPPRRDKAATAFLVAMGLALTVAAGASLSAVATGAFQQAMQAVGFGRAEAIADEQRRQAAEVDQVQQVVGDLKGAVARLERYHPHLSRELAKLQTRIEKSGQTDVAIINRIGGLFADHATLKAEMVALRGAASEAASRAEAAVTERLAKLDSDVSALRSEVAGTDRFAWIDADLSTLRRELSAIKLDAGEAGADAPWRAHVDDLNANLARVGIDVGTLRSSLDAREKAQRSVIEAQRAEIKVQHANIAAIANRIDRLERIAAARDATGSVSVKPPRNRDRRALSGWSVHTAGSDSAVITGASGTYEVKPGTIVPGLGRIADLRQRGKRWIVVTDKGVIAER